MARQPGGLTELVAFMATPADKARLSALAKRRHQTMSQLLRQLVEREMQRWSRGTESEAARS